MFGLALKFMFQYWRFFAGAFVLVGLYFAYTNHIENIRLAGMEEGIKKQAAKDKADLDALQTRYDAKVAWLEGHSTDLANGLTKTNTVNSVRVAELNRLLAEKIKELDRTTYDSEGKAIECFLPGKELHLGAEFSKTWNKYNSDMKVK